MLKLSSRARYAVRIMVRLALAPDGQSVTKQKIAKAEGISADYVEQILIRLRTGGLVRSLRGTKGGFALARPADDITVKDTLERADGPLALAPCSTSDCRRATQCITRSVWSAAEAALIRIFNENTIRGLADQARTIESAEGSFEI
jgi:Rrf2 family transcriptional regulator, cysteine metabolism repressor